MKKLITLLALAIAPLASSAQHIIFQNDICPDWTFTDINGTEHNLYSYLDAGYTVFFDASTTWCPPCWDIHQSHVLDSLYLNYGPGTAANNIMVFLIETDDNTGLDDLQGTGTNTLGDWITGTPYPIIDDAESLRDLLHFNSVPYVWSVCANRVIGPGYSSTMAEMATTAQNCQDFYLADSPNDAALLYVVDWNRCYGQQRDLYVHLQNVGTAPLTNASLETTVFVHQDQSMPLIDTLEWTGVLGTYEYETLTSANMNLPIGHHAASVRLLGTDDFALNNTATAVAIAGTTAPGTQITLELLTDDHAADLRWSLIRAEEQLPVDGVPSGTYANNTFYTETWNLEEDVCYAFSVSTSNNQGLSAPGYFRLLANGVPFSGDATLLYNVETVDFRTDSDVGLNDANDQTPFIIMPNPMEDHATLDLRDVQGSIHISLMDPTGRTILTRSSTGGSLIALEREGLPSGSYFLQVKSSSGQLRWGKLMVQ